MSFFDRFRKKSTEQEREAIDEPLLKKLVELILSSLRDQDGRIHAEDAISAAATIVGERCIEAAGNYPLRDHDFAPGKRIFSETVNKLISGDIVDIDKIPGDTIVGLLRIRLDRQVYPNAEFPSLTEVFQQYAARIGKLEDWGKVPLSVGEDHLPFIPPLQVGYQTRAHVDEILHFISGDKVRCLRIATESLADILTMVASTIDHKIALMLAIETINGMAKTAPMTTKAMQQLQQGTPRPTG